MDWNRDDVVVGVNVVVLEVVAAVADVDGNAKPEMTLVVEAVAVDVPGMAAVRAGVVAAVVTDDPNGADPNKGTDAVDAVEVEGWDENRGVAVAEGAAELVVVVIAGVADYDGAGTVGPNNIEGAFVERAGDEVALANPNTGWAPGAPGVPLPPKSAAVDEVVAAAAAAVEEAAIEDVTAEEVGFKDNELLPEENRGVDEERLKGRRMKKKLWRTLGRKRGKMKQLLVTM